MNIYSPVGGEGPFQLRASCGNCSLHRKISEGFLKVTKAATTQTAFSVQSQELEHYQTIEKYSQKSAQEVLVALSLTGQKACSCFHPSFPLCPSATYKELDGD